MNKLSEKNQLKLIYKNQKPLCLVGNSVLSYSKGSLFLLNLQTKGKSKLCSIFTGIRGLLSHIRIFERILRLSPRVGIAISDTEALVSYNNGFYRVNITDKSCTLEHSFRCGMHHPLNATKIENVDGFDSCVAYGEYWQNSLHEGVSIYTRMNNKCIWKAAYTFPENTVKHIHNIVPDSIHNCVYVLTGDSDEESGIWRFKNNFSSIEKLLVGKQMYRACFLKPYENELLFITDTPALQNCIYTYSLQDGSITQKMNIPGSCISATNIFDDKIIFCTAVEYMDRKRKCLDLISYRRDKGIYDWYSHVFVGDNSDGFNEIYSSKKDVLPMGLCQFGNFDFVPIDENIALIYAISLSKIDNNVLSLERGSI